VSHRDTSFFPAARFIPYSRTSLRPIRRRAACLRLAESRVTHTRPPAFAGQALLLLTAQEATYAALCSISLPTPINAAVTSLVPAEALRFSSGSEHNARPVGTDCTEAYCRGDLASVAETNPVPTGWADASKARHSLRPGSPDGAQPNRGVHKEAGQPPPSGRQLVAHSTPIIIPRSTPTAVILRSTPTTVLQRNSQ